MSRRFSPTVSAEVTLRFDHDQVGPGYEAPTEASRKAMADAGRCEGAILDPVYTAKGFAGRGCGVRRDPAGPANGVRPHGGLPGLYGNPAAAELAARIAKAAAPLG